MFSQIHAFLLLKILFHVVKHLEILFFIWIWCFNFGYLFTWATCLFGGTFGILFCKFCFQAFPVFGS